MKTIAQQLNIKEFPFIIYDKNGNKIYQENEVNVHFRCEYDSRGNEILYEHMCGYWRRTEYDQHNNVITKIDRNGIILDNKLEIEILTK